MMLADLHVHSTYSDGQMSIPKLVDFYGSRGFGCIAITDHICEQKTVLGLAARYLRYTLRPDNFNDYMAEIDREAERAWRQYQMLVLPGFEISKNSFTNHRSAHLLAIGVREWICPDLSIVEASRAIRSAGGLCVAAHPVDTRINERQTYHLWSRREELKHEFDAWEVASGPHWFDEVAQSGLPMLATSDLHRPEQLRSWKTRFPTEAFADGLNQRTLIEAVRNQNLEFVMYDDRHWCS